MIIELFSHGWGRDQILDMPVSAARLALKGVQRAQSIAALCVLQGVGVGAGGVLSKQGSHGYKKFQRELIKKANG